MRAVKKHMSRFAGPPAKALPGQAAMVPTTPAIEPIALLNRRMCFDGSIEVRRCW
jgi:hypothetical protein